MGTPQRRYALAKRPCALVKTGGRITAQAGGHMTENSDGWIEVVGWARFQHYGKRNPPWIKVYTSLLHKVAFVQLTSHQTKLLLHIWLTYATTNGDLPDNTLTLSRQLGMKVARRDIDALCHAGFLSIVASKPLAERYAQTETETETETDPPNPPQMRGAEKLKRDSHKVGRRIDPPDYGDSTTPPDPEALQHLREMAARVGKPIA